VRERERERWINREMEGKDTERKKDRETERKGAK
jgi:hypothetical protein